MTSWEVKTTLSQVASSSSVVDVTRSSLCIHADGMGERGRLPGRESRASTSHSNTASGTYQPLGRMPDTGLASATFPLNCPRSIGTHEKNAMISGLSRNRRRACPNRIVFQAAQGISEALNICGMPGVLDHHEGLTETTSVGTGDYFYSSLHSTILSGTYLHASRVKSLCALFFPDGHDRTERALVLFVGVSLWWLVPPRPNAPDADSGWAGSSSPEAPLPAS
jgi:hypothetical protein